MGTKDGKCNKTLKFVLWCHKLKQKRGNQFANVFCVFHQRMLKLQKLHMQTETQREASACVLLMEFNTQAFACECWHSCVCGCWWFSMEGHWNSRAKLTGPLSHTAEPLDSISITPSHDYTNAPLQDGQGFVFFLVSVESLKDGTTHQLCYEKLVQTKMKTSHFKFLLPQNSTSPLTMNICH